MVPEKKNLKGLWLTIFLTAVTAVSIIIYLRLNDAVKDRFLLAATVILVAVIVIAAVWSGRCKIIGQEESIVELHRRTPAVQTEIPAQFHIIYEQVSLSLKSRAYYEGRLLPRINGDQIDAVQAEFDPAPIRSGFITSILNFISGKRVTCDEIRNQIDRNKSNQREGDRWI